jgi:hypothetical protein
MSYRISVHVGREFVLDPGVMMRSWCMNSNALALATKNTGKATHYMVCGMPDVRLATSGNVCVKIRDPHDNTRVKFSAKGVCRASARARVCVCARVC